MHGNKMKISFSEQMQVKEYLTIIETIIYSFRKLLKMYHKKELIAKYIFFLHNMIPNAFSVHPKDIKLQ